MMRIAIRYWTERQYFLFALVICLCFFAAYAVLSIVRHDHFQSFGYDLGINDQVVWRYSRFQLPLTTIDPFPDRIKLVEHIELVYALISPFYWIWSSRKMLLILQTAFVCFSGIAVYLLAKKRGLRESISLSLLFSYLGFYGVQNAIWFDVHSACFAAAFIMWFIYCLETKKKWPSIIFFLLAITAKENVGILTFLISVVFLIRQRTKLLYLFIITSVAYLFFVFYIYFPHIVHTSYLYANKDGILSNTNPLSLIDTGEKRQVIFYALLSFGFLPFLSPLTLLPVLGDLATYFVIGSELPGAQGLFMQYRITLAPLLVWVTIVSLTKHRMLNIRFVAMYLLVSTLLVQYLLHLPLSYLSKSWFWVEPSGVKNIREIISRDLPPDASVVSQNNITPHISHRDKIYTLYPEKRSFTMQSPCGERECDWFRWADHPEYLIVDTSPEWDARHLLINRDNYIKGLANLETTGIIKTYKRVGRAVLYKVMKPPESTE